MPGYDDIVDLDQLYALPPVGSDENPMNMEAIRFDEDIGSGRIPMNMEGMRMREDAVGNETDSPVTLQEGETVDDVIGPPDTRPVRKVETPGGGWYYTREPEKTVGDRLRAAGKAVTGWATGEGGGPTRQYTVDDPKTGKTRQIEYYGPSEMSPEMRAKLGIRDTSGAAKKKTSAGGPVAGGPGMGPPPGVVPSLTGEQPQGAAQWDEFIEQPQGGAVASSAPGAEGAEVDAISGGNHPQGPAGPGDDMAFWSRQGAMPISPEEEFARQAAMTPEERILENTRREFQRQQIGLDGVATAAAKARVDAEQNLKALESAHAQTKKERDEILKRPGWWEGRSTGQKIALYVSSIAGGMLAAFQGHTRNPATEAMHQAIDQDAEERAQELAAAQGDFADAQDLFKFKELARIRAYEDATQQTLIQMQKYDPNGSMAAQSLAQIQDYKARQAEAEQKVVEHNWKKKHQLLQIASEERQKQAQLAQAERESRRQAGVQYSAQRNDMIKAGWMRDAKGNWVPDPKVVSQRAKDAADLENTEARTENVRLETQDKQLALSGGANPYAIGDSTGKPYRQADGSVFAIKDTTRREEISQINQAAYNVRRIADLIKIIREKEGGASAAIGSPEYQELKSLAAQTDFETYKAYGLGAPSSGDQQLAGAARGGKDITSFIYSPEAGFESYAQGVESKLNMALRSAQYTGPKVVIPRMRAPNEEDLALERARSYPPGSFLPGSKYREAAEKGKAERDAEAPAEDEEPPSYAPLHEDEVENPWEDSIRGKKK